MYIDVERQRILKEKRKKIEDLVKNIYEARFGEIKKFITGFNPIHIANYLIENIGISGDLRFTLTCEIDKINEWEYNRTYNIFLNVILELEKY